MTPHSHDHSLFLNRELSWLAFNERVLEEAADVTNPLLERVKFVAIAASNLDEFFMVRVAGLKEAVEDPRANTDLCGMTPLAQLTAVGLRAHEFVDRLYRLALHDLLPELDRVRQHYGDKVQMIGVNITVNDSRDRVRRYLALHKPPFLALYDDTSVSSRAFDVPTTAYIVVLDAKGTVVYTGSGSDQDLVAAVAKAVPR